MFHKTVYWDLFLFCIHRFIINSLNCFKFYLFTDNILSTSLDLPLNSNIMTRRINRKLQSINKCLVDIKIYITANKPNICCVRINVTSSYLYYKWTTIKFTKLNKLIAWVDIFINILNAETSILNTHALI